MSMQRDAAAFGDLVKAASSNSLARSLALAHRAFVNNVVDTFGSNSSSKKIMSPLLPPPLVAVVVVQSTLVELLVELVE